MSDADLRALLAVDLPDPEEYAEALVTLNPKLGRFLMTANRTPDGWRLRVAESELIREARSLGLVEVPGHNPPPAPASKRKGYFLSNFGASVLIQLIRLEVSQ